MNSPARQEKIDLRTNIMEYPVSVGSPKIVPVNIDPLKFEDINKVNQILEDRYRKILKDAETLLDEFKINSEVYTSRYKFEPIVGHIYHLYEDSGGKKFLSLVDPNSWSQKHLYSVVLDSDKVWKKIP